MSCKSMIPKIKELRPQDNYKLEVIFDNGYKVIYDVSRTCVYWNDEIDLPSDTIYEYGRHLEM